jgi:hypothetical protein
MQPVRGPHQDLGHFAITLLDELGALVEVDEQPDGGRDHEHQGDGHDEQEDI